MRKKIETWLDQAFPSRGKNDKSKNLIKAWKSNILDEAHTIVDGTRCADEVGVTLITYLAPPAVFSHHQREFRASRLNLRERIPPCEVVGSGDGLSNGVQCEVLS